MKKRLLACLLTAAMLVSLFPLPALAAEAQRPEWMVTAFDPLDGLSGHAFNEFLFVHSSSHPAEGDFAP